MPLAAVVEIASDLEGRLPVPLIQTAYRASRSGPVVLVLRDVSPLAVDRVLDDVVASTPSVHGVRYCAARDLGELVAREGAPRLALVAGSAHPELLADPATLVVPPAEGLARLESLGGERPAAAQDAAAG
jgi:hypothetical protein